MRSQFRLQGFTLLEMGMVLLIISTVVGGGLAIFMGSVETSREVDTAAKLKTIQQALRDFRLANERLPCPADPTLALDDVAYGKESLVTAGTCDGANTTMLNQAGTAGGSIAMGMVPVRALKLPDEMAIDGWGRRIMFSTDYHLTTPYAYRRLPVNEDMRFIREDRGTQGDWVNNYGNDGYYVLGGGISMPNFGSISVVGGTTFSWADTTRITTTDPASLLRLITSSTTDRVARCWYTTTSMIFQLIINDGHPHLLSMYFMDWDGSRGQRVTLTDELNGSKVISPRYITGFQNGVYLTYLVTGTTRLTIDTVTGTNAVFSGLFFDFAFAPMNVLTPVTLTPKVSHPDYILTSFGKNGHGAYPRKGGATRISTGSLNAAELANCKCSSAAAANIAAGTAYYQSAPTSEDITNPLKAFDDIVVYGTRTALSLPGAQ